MTNLNKSKSEVNVGIDVGKLYLDICIYEKAITWQERNDAHGIKNILRRLSYYQVERLVVEATGRYEFNLAESPPALLNPYPFVVMQEPLNSLQKRTVLMQK